MARFLKRLGIYSLVVFILIFLLSADWDKKIYKRSFMTSIEDKHNRLRSISGPRLIFVGGSSTAFGINSEEVQKELGIPVVNMAIIAGLGLDFILKEVESEMRAGDIVVLSPEYYMNNEGNYELKVFTEKCWPEAGKYFKQDYIKNYTSVRVKQIKENFRFLLDSIVKKRPFVLDYNTMYDFKSSFNEYGDVVAHLNNNIAPPHVLKDKGYTKLNYFYYDDGIKRLNKFYEAAQAKGVRAYFTYHPYAASQYNLSSDTYARYHQDLLKDMKIPVIGKPDDFIYDDSLFFDTVLHLNKEAREMRTKKLIGMLKEQGIPGKL